MPRNPFALPIAASFLVSIFGLPSVVQAADSSTVTTDLVVASDGSAPYKTVQDAISAAATGSPDHPTVIHVKPGVYKELVYIQREKSYVRLIGDDSDPSKTVITYNQSANQLGADGKPIGTFHTPTVYIDADHFTAENITFDNSAGAVGQALAIRVDGDCVAFKNCSFTGWQDTILDNRGRHYYDHCSVTGAVDFIFGGATAVYDHCDITELRDKGGDITAPSTPQDQKYGLVFLDSKLNTLPTVLSGSTGLMRPWRQYGESAFIRCTLSPAIKAQGWDTWTGRELTCRALEFNSIEPDGKTVDTSQRSAWSHQLSTSEAADYTLPNIFGDWDWHTAE